MRIAFFHELPPGGARIVVSEIAKKLSKDHTVDLYYSDKSSSRLEHSGYNKVYFYKFVPKSWRGSNFKIRLYKDTIELVKLNSLHRKIAKAIDQKKYDLVFVNASKFVEAPFVLRHLKTKKVFYLHDPHFRVIYEKKINLFKNLDIFRSSYERIHHRMLAHLDKQNIYKADFLLANSAYTSTQAYKTYVLKSKVVYLGVDVNFFKPAKIIKKDIDVLFIGSKDILDGYDIFEKITKNLNTNMRVEKLLKDEEWLTQEKVRELYRRSKIVLCLGRNEPFGLIPLEAGACESTVIALKEGGYPETVIDNQTGVLVQANHKKILESIMYLLNHSKKRTQMGITARKNIIKHWDWKVRIKQLEAELRTSTK